MTAQSERPSGDLADIVEAKRAEIERWDGIDASLASMEAVVACPRDGHSWWSIMGLRYCGRCGERGS